jgi:hypothetical protein
MNNYFLEYTALSQNSKGILAYPFKISVNLKNTHAVFLTKND